MKNWPDQLYRFLPAVHQIRDGEQREPLRAFLQIIGEQTQEIQDDIEQLYDNWFIETSEDWVVPYLGDLMGFRRQGAVGEPADAITPRGQLLNRFLYPRREIANLVRRRRRKGTLSVLEDMARDVSGWPSRAVEFSRLVTFFQNVKHPLPDMGRTFSLRDKGSHPRVNTPFDRVAHTVDVRTIQPLPGVGWYHPKKVGLFVWQRKVLPATMVCPCRTCKKVVNNSIEVQYYTFNRLGIEVPLYVRPAEETDELHIAEESNLPVPLYRHLLADKDGHPKDIYYGLGATVPKSLAIQVKLAADQDWSLVPADKICVADLCEQTRADLFHNLGCDRLAVDPERGLLLFGCKAPPCEVRVSYHYVVTMEVGGGEYERQPIDKPGTQVVRVRNESCCANGTAANLFEAVLKELQMLQSIPSRCSPRCQPRTVTRLRKEDPDPANHCDDKWIVEDDLCIEITESDTFQIPANETLCIQPGKTLIIRAAQETWPMLHLPPSDNQICHSPWHVRMGEGTTLVCDGILVCGVTMQLDEGAQSNNEPPVAPAGCRPCDEQSAAGHHSPKPPELHLRHTTFVPGGRAESCLSCQHASICLNLSQGRVTIRHSIVGTLNVEHSKCTNCCGKTHDPASTCPLEPMSIEVSDSIIDAAHNLPSVYSNCCSPAHADLTIERSTILGDICVQQITRAEDSLFAGIVHVQRRGHGYMRFCYVPGSRTEIPNLDGGNGCRGLSVLKALGDRLSQLIGENFYDSAGADWCHKIRTPPRFKCIPESKAPAEQTACSTGCGDTALASAMAQTPGFISTEYGRPGYCELGLSTDLRILRGAEDQSEFGVYHDLFRPQRDAALRLRLQEYTPADMQSAVIYADDLHPMWFGRCDQYLAPDQ